MDTVLTDPNTEPIIRVLCVDDHRLMREGIVRIIGFDAGVTVVAEGGTGEEAVEKFLQHRPDVTLMDLQLRGMNGLQAIRTIRTLQPDARIVVLTMYEGDETIYDALEAGAAGYLLKDSVPADLIRVIREVHAGSRSIPPHIEAKLEARLGRPKLTVREKEVLDLLARGLRNKEIAAELRISEETARAHIKGIFQKLRVHDRTAALAEALRRGLARVS
jgi:two-component system, NarL family, response regulator